LHFLATSTHTVLNMAWHLVTVRNLTTFGPHRWQILALGRFAMQHKCQKQAARPVLREIDLTREFYFPLLNRTLPTFAFSYMCISLIPSYKQLHFFPLEGQRFQSKPVFELQFRSDWHSSGKVVWSNVHANSEECFFFKIDVTSCQTICKTKFNLEIKGKHPTASVGYSVTTRNEESFKPFF